MVPDSEHSPRLAKQLGGLLLGLDAIGVDRADGWRLIDRVARDTIPPNRCTVIDRLATADPHDWVQTGPIAEAGSWAPAYAQRVLEDLQVHKVAERNPDQENIHLWRLAPWARAAWPAAEGTH